MKPTDESKISDDLTERSLDLPEGRSTFLPSEVGGVVQSLASRYSGLRTEEVIALGERLGFFPAGSSSEPAGKGRVESEGTGTRRIKPMRYTSYVDVFKMSESFSGAKKMTSESQDICKTIARGLWDPIVNGSGELDTDPVYEKVCQIHKISKSNYFIFCSKVRALLCFYLGSGEEQEEARRKYADNTPSASLIKLFIKNGVNTREQFLGEEPRDGSGENPKKQKVRKSVKKRRKSKSKKSVTARKPKAAKKVRKTATRKSAREMLSEAKKKIAKRRAKKPRRAPKPRKPARKIHAKLSMEKQFDDRIEAIDQKIERLQEVRKSLVAAKDRLAEFAGILSKSDDELLE